MATHLFFPATCLGVGVETEDSGLSNGPLWSSRTTSYIYYIYLPLLGTTKKSCSTARGDESMQNIMMEGDDAVCGSLDIRALW